jgi:hypothetical protein
MDRVRLEKLTVSQLVKKFPVFYKPEGSLPCLPQTATCPYLEPQKMQSFSHPICLQHILITSYLSLRLPGSFLQFPQQNPVWISPKSTVLKVNSITGYFISPLVCYLNMYLPKLFIVFFVFSKGGGAGVNCNHSSPTPKLPFSFLGLKNRCVF